MFCVRSQSRPAAPHRQHPARLDFVVLNELSYLPSRSLAPRTAISWKMKQLDAPPGAQVALHRLGIARSVVSRSLSSVRRARMARSCSLTIPAAGAHPSSGPSAAESSWRTCSIDKPKSRAADQSKARYVRPIVGSAAVRSPLGGRKKPNAFIVADRRRTAP